MRLREHEAIQDGKLDMFRADPRKLVTEPHYNVRDLTTPDAIGKLEELANSIAEVGVQDPLVVRFDGERIIVVEGHRRLAATLMAIERGAEIKSVPIYQEARGINDAQRDLGLIISNAGEPLTPLEKAKVVGRLVAHGWSHAEIAKKCGWKSVGSINQYLDMLALPEKVKEHVRQGDISATTARNLAKSELSPEEQDARIKANLEENKRLGVGKRHKTQTKVTRKTLERDKPKAKPQAGAATPSTAVHAEPPASTALPAEQSAPDQTPPMAMVDEFNRWTPPSHSLALAHMAGSTGKLIAALEPFANLAHEHDFNERSDDDVVEVPFRHLKRAWIVFAAVMGTDADSVSQEVATEDAA